MEQHIRVYVDELFESAPKTQKAYEMKVELAENLIEKYNDLIAEGKTPEDAYNITIMSIGDVSELFASLYDIQQYPQEVNAARTRSASFMAIAIMIYILSFIPVIVFNGNFGVILMFIMWALATGIIIFTQMSKPRELTREATIVSEFKDWQTRNNSRKQLKRAIDTILWSLIVVIYVLISFGTMKWYITWVIFPVGVALEGLISAIFSMTQER